MSIEKDDRTYQLRCDVCGKTQKGFKNFYEAVDFKKDKESNGWRSRKFDSDWKDLCPSCSANRKP